MSKLLKWILILGVIIIVLMIINRTFISWPSKITKCDTSLGVAYTYSYNVYDGGGPTIILDGEHVSCGYPYTSSECRAFDEVMIDAQCKTVFASSVNIYGESSKFTFDFFSAMITKFIAFISR